MINFCLKGKYTITIDSFIPYSFDGIASIVPLKNKRYLGTSPSEPIFIIDLNTKTKSFYTAAYILGDKYFIAPFPDFDED